MQKQIFYLCYQIYILLNGYLIRTVCLFCKENSKLEIFTVSLVILYVPLFILFRLLHTFLQNVIKERV